MVIRIELSTSFKNQEDFKNIKHQWYFDGLDSQPDEEFEENGLLCNSFGKW